TSGQAIAIADVSKDPHFARDVAESTGYMPRSILAMPLETERGMIGVIEVLDRGEGTASGDEMEILGLFAHQAALAIENSRIFSELGHALFTAAAEGARKGNLRDALVSAAEDGRQPNPRLVELASTFSEVSRAGSGEQLAASRMLAEFAAYLRRRKRRG
ncbi:MAG: GAF domain-containing protein, partial [Dehalococcoidia bacterium]|nr:GAF domain-containing protein [Dehalococcoidia bacterium]